MAAVKKSGDTQAVVLARLEEQLANNNKELKELKAYLKNDHLRYVEDRIKALEGKNALQDEKIEKNTKAMWKVQTIYTTIIVVVNLAFMAWRVFG